MITNLAELCVDLDPTEVLFGGKNESAPQEKNPFIVKSNSSKVEIDDTVELTLTSNELHKFKGFILQSRYGDDFLVGTFLRQPNISLYDCDQDGLNIPEFKMSEIVKEHKISKRVGKIIYFYFSDYSYLL